MEKRRVVVTGFGMISPLGNSADESWGALCAGKSGIRFDPQMTAHGFKSQLSARPPEPSTDSIDPKALRFLGPGVIYGYLALEEAIKNAGLTCEHVTHDRTGLIVGSGGPSTVDFFAAHEAVRLHNSTKRISPTSIVKCMSSTASASLAPAFGIRGIGTTVTSACATSLSCIIAGVKDIQLGLHDIIFAGGCELVDWTLSCLFDSMGAMSRRNDDPEHASRPFDKNRDGFVIAGGGGIVVLEELQHALKRDATIYGELLGYGETSDGVDFVAPSGEGAARCMRLALKTLPKGRRVTYLNAHGTSTPLGDTAEIQAIREVFCNNMPLITSTKGQTGHMIGAAGVNEFVFAILMMLHRFIPPSANIFELDPDIHEGEVLVVPWRGEIDAVMSNSFGFGGTNASILVGAYRD